MEGRTDGYRARARCPSLQPSRETVSSLLSARLGLAQGAEPAKAHVEDFPRDCPTLGSIYLYERPNSFGGAAAPLTFRKIGMCGILDGLDARRPWRAREA